MKKIYILTAITFASFAFASAQNVPEKPTQPQPTKPGIRQGIQNLKSLLPFGGQGTQQNEKPKMDNSTLKTEKNKIPNPNTQNIQGEKPNPNNSEMQNQRPQITTGDPAIDEQVRALNKEMEDKIKAIRDEYMSKIKAIVGDKIPTGLPASQNENGNDNGNGRPIKPMMRANPNNIQTQDSANVVPSEGQIQPNQRQNINDNGNGRQERPQMRTNTNGGPNVGQMPPVPPSGMPARTGEVKGVSTGPVGQGTDSVIRNFFRGIFSR